MWIHSLHAYIHIQPDVYVCPFYHLFFMCKHFSFNVLYLLQTRLLSCWLFSPNQTLDKNLLCRLKISNWLLLIYSFFFRNLQIRNLISMEFSSGMHFSPISSLRLIIGTAVLFAYRPMIGIVLWFCQVCTTIQNVEVLHSSRCEFHTCSILKFLPLKCAWKFITKIIIWFQDIHNVQQPIQYLNYVVVCNGSFNWETLFENTLLLKIWLKTF